MHLLSNHETPLISGGRPPILDEINDRLEQAISANAAKTFLTGLRGAPISPASAVISSAITGWNIGTYLNNHVVDPYIVQPWIMRQSN